MTMRIQRLCIILLPLMTRGWMLRLPSSSLSSGPLAARNRRMRLSVSTSPSSSSSSSSSLKSTLADSNNTNHPSTQPNSNSNTRWTGSGRWEQQGSGSAQQFLLQEKFGTYFQVPNPSTLLTKIICTIGPATASDPAALGRMMDAGMSAARINMSHAADYEAAAAAIDAIRQVAATRRRLCPIILDTQGPEIRVHWISTDDESTTSLVLNSGDPFVLLTGKYAEKQNDADSQGEEEDKRFKNLDLDEDTNAAAVTYAYLANSVQRGDVVLLDDGRISLSVTAVPSEHEVHATVVQGGRLVRNKGVNLPGCHVELPHLTDKDQQDIRFGVSKRVEYIAHSFTRSATGINQVREVPGVVESGAHIIAKIESQEGLDNFESILRCSDGIMVARGDLGVEIPLERVCSVQKRLVASCNAVGKPVIVATELLDSMISNPRPTRAEASDVANAVFDGADCVMLSGETAIGKYPIESIQVMNRICKEAELDVASSLRGMAANPAHVRGVGTPTTTKNGNSSEGHALRDAFAKSAIMAARETGASMIIAITRTGLTANALAKYFSPVPVMVLATSPQVCAQVLLHRSVTPYLVDSLERSSCVPRAIAKAMEWDLVGPGSRVLLLTGRDDLIANRLETFVVGESVLPPPSFSTDENDHAP